MRFRMIPLCLLIFACLTHSFGQDRKPECPSIDVIGPPGIAKPDDKITYAAKVGRSGDISDLKYHWTSSGGEIVAGQGTSAIEIRLPQHTGLTVTVEISGLPKDCPMTASESAIWDHAPEAVRIGAIHSAEQFTEKLKEFADELARNPSDQGYIIIGYRPDAPAAEINARENRIIENFRPLFGYHPPPITLVRWDGKIDIVELWRIPPGAENPTCNDCDTQTKCPTISVIGPSGISMPGETIYFRAAIDAEAGSFKAFRWTVSDGVIVSGRNTLKLGVRMPKRPPVIATILLEGLPKECSNSGSGRYDFVIDPGPILTHEFGSLTNSALRKRLDSLFAELRNELTSQGYIILYGSTREITACERLIVDNIRLRRFPRDRITIVKGGVLPGGKVLTKVYRVPPGAENPTP